MEELTKLNWYNDRLNECEWVWVNNHEEIHEREIILWNRGVLNEYLLFRLKSNQFFEELNYWILIGE